MKCRCKNVKFYRNHNANDISCNQLTELSLSRLAPTTTKLLSLLSITVISWHFMQMLICQNWIQIRHIVISSSVKLKQTRNRRLSHSVDTWTKYKFRQNRLFYFGFGEDGKQSSTNTEKRESETTITVFTLGTHLMTKKMKHTLNSIVHTARSMTKFDQLIIQIALLFWLLLKRNHKIDTLTSSSSFFLSFEH